MYRRRSRRLLVLQPPCTVLTVHDLFVWCVCGWSHCVARSVSVLSTPQCLAAGYRYLAEVLVKHVNANCYSWHRMLLLWFCLMYWCNFMDRYWHVGKTFAELGAAVFSKMLVCIYHCTYCHIPSHNCIRVCHVLILFVCILSIAPILKPMCFGNLLNFFVSWMEAYIAEFPV